VSQPPGVAPRPWRSPVQLLAFGLGSGLSPRAPGTVGTLAAVPAYFLLAERGLVVYSMVVIAAAVFGVWLCGAASRALHVHDHPGIVWDEWVGYWVTLWALPVEWQWVISGFVVFRVFDVLKPWPIGLLDRRVSGGLGIMADDLVAGAMACVTLHMANWLL